MKKITNEKGFTLIELLVVVSIIAILFVILVPQIDNASVRAREAGVKTDFHSMQLGMTMFFNENIGKVTRLNNTEDFNPYLDKSMQITNTSGGDTNSDGYLDVAATGVFDKKDPWNNSYQIVQMASVDWVTGIKVVIKSVGKNEIMEGYVLNNTYDDYTLTFYKKHGKLDHCTYGFQSNNIELKKFEYRGDTNGDGMVGCGDDIN